MKRLILILLCYIFHSLAFGQSDSQQVKVLSDTTVRRPVVRQEKAVRKKPSADSLRRKFLQDSLLLQDSAVLRDTTTVLAAPVTGPPLGPPVMQKKPRARPIDSFYLKMLDNPYLRTTAKPVFLVINERQRKSKDEIFYLLAGLMLLLAFIKLVFSQYFGNIFRLFFQPSFRQKQTREQLAQNNLPSLLLNLFFILSASAYIALLIDYYSLSDKTFWEIYIYSTACLFILYLGKFILLSFTGWIFDVSDTSRTYIFIVYLINKIVGVALVPFTLVIAFSQPQIITGFITISLLLIFLLFLYRYFVSFTSIRSDVKINVMHFMLYILAFEVTPLLLIYKTLNVYLNKSS